MNRKLLRTGVFFLVLALLGSGLCSCEKPAVPTYAGGLLIKHDVPLAWKEIVPGLRITRLEFESEKDGRKIMMAALEVDPKFFRFSLLSAPEIFQKPAAMVHEMAAREKPLAAVNASFYLPEDYEPIGLVVNEGKVLHPWKSGAGSGVFRADRGKVRIEWAKSFRKEWENNRLVVQAGPLVVEPGGKPGIYQDTSKYRERTAVGLDGKGDVILVCNYRKDDLGFDLDGLDLYEFMRIMMAPRERGGLGLNVALNLDGGASSAMYVDLPPVWLDIRSINPVANAIAVYPRQPVGAGRE